jgi:hypothetical protein
MRSISASTEDVFGYDIDSGMKQRLTATLSWNGEAKCL